MLQNSIIGQYLNPMMLDYITKFVKHNIEITDNNLRADVIVQYLNEFGFREIGCGTNRITLKHENDESLVFKIALDERGITDNNLEELLAPKLQPYVTVMYDNVGTISVSEFVHTMKREDMDDYYDAVSEILHRVGSRYILNDVGPNEFKNWGIRPDTNEIVILDFAYLTPITEEMDFSCRARVPGKKHKRCGGQLKYSNDFSKFVCTSCNAEFAIGDIAATPGRDSTREFNTIGLSADNYPALEQIEPGQLVYQRDEDYDDMGFNTSN